MINEPFLPTIGVELEAIFAFHETLLREHLQNTENHSEIVKDIPDDARKELNQVNDLYRLRRPKYMGWGLTTPTTYDGATNDEKRQRSFENQLREYKYRGYAGEILALAKTFLPKRVRVHDSWRLPYSNFKHWHLTHDNSLTGVSKDVLAQELRNANHEIDDIANWDNHPLELVSRVLPFTKASLDEISTNLYRLLGTPFDLHTAFTNESCGFHVHVGLPTPANHPPGTPPPTFSLPTLQHLAYILVMYEKPMTKLFPARRKPSHGINWIDLQTNLDNFIPEQGMEEMDGDFDAYRDDDAEENDNVDDDPAAPPAEKEQPDSDTSDKPECSTVSFAAARRKIFARDQTLEKLVKLICGTSKGHLVNWTYLLRTDGSPRTLEFRQHEGILDPAGVQHWVRFVVGLVRLAEERARVDGVGELVEVEEGRDSEWVCYDGKGYKWPEWDEEVGIMDLVEMIGLGREGREWVDRRVGMWEEEE